MPYFIFLFLGMVLIVIAPESWGQADFVQYWSAHALLEDNLNPYDPQELLRVERTLGWDKELPLMMWNPPWTLVLLDPLLRLEFGLASKIWLGLNAIILLSGIWLLLPRAQSVLVVLTFIPALLVLYLGQLSVLLFFSVAVCVWAIRERHDFIAGLALVFLSVKPQPVYLLILAISCWALQQRRWAILSSAAFGFGLLLMLTPLSSFHHWITALQTPPGQSLVLTPRQWLTSAPLLALTEYSGFESLMVLGPALASFSVLGYFLLCRPQALGDSHLHFFLCFSALTTPFVWLYDFVVLLPVQLSIMLRSRLAFATCLLHQTYVLLEFFNADGFMHHGYAVSFVPLLFLAYIVMIPRCQTDKGVSTKV